MVILLVNLFYEAIHKDDFKNSWKYFVECSKNNKYIQQIEKNVMKSKLPCLNQVFFLTEIISLKLSNLETVRGEFASSRLKFAT